MANGGGFYSETMRHYQDACQEYQALSINDDKFQQRMKSMVQDFHSPAGGEGNSSTPIPSFDNIKEATVCMLENNNKCAEEILAYKEDLGGNAQILLMVNSYFELCQTTLDSLHGFLVRLCCSRDKLMALRGNLTVDRKVREAVTYAEGTVDYFFLSLPGLNRKYVQMLHKLQQARDKEMPTRAGRADNPTPRRLIAIMFWTVFTGAVILSILAALPNAPQVLAAVSTAVISVYGCGPFVKWMEGFWNTAEETKGVATGEKRIVVIRELEDIKLSVVIRELEDIKLSAVCNREKAVEAVLKTMAELNEQVEKCYHEICTARNNFLQKITEPQRCRDRARAFVYRQVARMEQKKDTFLEKTSEMFDNFRMNRKK